jgi:hypothetical protein
VRARERETTTTYRDDDDNTTLKSVRVEGAQDNVTYTLNSNAFRLSTHGDDADQADFLNILPNILNNELCLMHFWACLFVFGWFCAKLHKR